MTAGGGEAGLTGVGEESWLSQALLLWCTRLVFRPPSQLDDLPGLPRGLSSSRLADALAGLARRGSVLRVVSRLHSSTMVLGLIAGVVHGLLATVLRSWLLMQLVRAVDQRDNDPARLGPLVCGLTVTLLVEGVTSTISKHWLSDRMGCAFFVTAGQLVQRSSLAGRGSGTPASELVGLDLCRALENAKFISFLPLGLAQISGGIGMLIWLLGAASAMVGVGAMLFLISVNFGVASFVKQAEGKSLAAADNRLELMKQMIFGAAAVKLSAWETPFCRRIKQERETECKHIRRKRFMEQWCVQMGRACPIVGAGGSFLYLGLSGSNDWEASHVFAALSVYQAMRMGLIMVPQTVALLGAVAASTQRLDAFLRLDQEAAIANPLFDGSTTELCADDGMKMCELAADGSSNAMPVFEQASFEWGGGSRA